MGTRELAAALNIDPGLVSRLVKRGMPMHSTDAANAWRVVHAPPRRRRESVQQAFNSAPAMQQQPDETFSFPPEWNEPPALDFSEAELAEVELPGEILETPVPRDIPPPGMFALSKNHFLHQFHAAKAKDKNRRRGVKRFIRPENAQALLDYLPPPGDCTHAVVRGDFVIGQIIPVILRGQSAEAVHISTLGMSRGNAEMLSDLRVKGQIGDLRILVSHYFAAVDANSTFAEVCRILGSAAPKVCRTHAKVILIAQPPDFFVVAGSANLRSSDNIEQFSIWNDIEVFDFHRRWMDEVFDKQ